MVAQGKTKRFGPIKPRGFTFEETEKKKKIGRKPDEMPDEVSFLPAGQFYPGTKGRALCCWLQCKLVIDCSAGTTNAKAEDSVNTTEQARAAVFGVKPKVREIIRLKYKKMRNIRKIRRLDY